MGIGPADPRLTAHAGLTAFSEVERVLGLGAALAAGIDGADGQHRLKTRARGLDGADLLLALTGAQLRGAEHWVRLEEHRADVVAAQLAPLPPPPSTTAAGLARRFTSEHLHGIETALATVNTQMLGLLPPARRAQLRAQVTLDGDATDIEVYGRTKDGAQHAYTGARVLRAHLVSWAQTALPLAADLLGGREDPRAGVVDLLDRALEALPAHVREHARSRTRSRSRSRIRSRIRSRSRIRWDAGYFAGQLAAACRARGVGFAIGANRNPAVVRAATAASAAGSAVRWTPAVGMHDTDVALIDYIPGRWPAGTRCIARRTRIPAQAIPSARARKRCTIPADQLALALQGQWEYVYAYSFIVTDLLEHDEHDEQR